MRANSYLEKKVIYMEQKIAIQDTYGERFQHCWGCGAKNEAGLHLKSYPTEDGSRCICRLTPGECYTGGVPENLIVMVRHQRHILHIIIKDLR